MADGKIVIDIDIPVDKVKTDAQLIDQVLNALGKDAGKKLDNSFEQSTSKVKQEADETSKEVNQKLSKPVQFKWTLDNKDVKDKTQQTDKEIKSVPKEVETKFSAVTDEAKSKTVELQNAFKAVPKSTETKNEVNNSDAKAKVKETKKELDSVPKDTKTKQTADNTDVKEKANQSKEEINKVPKKHNTDLDSTDKTKKATDSASKNADNAKHHFSILREVIKGTFIGNLASNPVEAALGALKDAFGGLITEGTHYNRLQQDMLAQWTTLTGSAGKGKELVKETNDLAIAAQNSTEMVNDLNQKFYAVTNSAGKTRELSKSVLTLQDAFDQSDDAVKNFAMQWSQMIGNGKANAQDMMSIQNVFPKFMEELVEYERKVTHNSKLTTSQVRDMMSAGKISADAMNTVLIGMGEKYKNATNNFSQTMDGMERTIHARIPVLAGAIVKPFQNLKNPLLGKMSNWIASSAAEKSFENFSKNIANNINVLMSTVNTFAMSFKANIGNAFNSTYLDGIGGSFKDLNKALTPVLQSIAGLAGVLSANIFKVFSELINGIADGLKNVGKQKSALDFSGITKIIQNLGQAFNAVMVYLHPLVREMGEFIGIFAKGALSTTIDLFQDISSFIGKISEKLVDLIPQMQGTSKSIDEVAKHRQAIELLGKAFALFVTAALAGKGTLSVFKGIKSGFEGIQGSVKTIKAAESTIKGLSEAFPSLANGVDKVKASFIALKDGFGALKGAFIANPFGMTLAVLLALGLAFYEAYKHIKPFREWVNKAAETVRKSFNGMVRNVEAFNKSFVKGFKAVIDWVKKNWKGLALLIVNPIAGGLKLLYDNNPKFKKWVDDLGKTISKGMQATINWIKKNWLGLALLIVNPISGAVKLLYDNNPKFKKWVDSLGKTFKKGWDGMLKAGHNCFKGLLTGIGNWGKDTHKWYDKFNSQFQKKWNNGWSNAKKNLVNSFDDMKRNTSNWGSNIHKWYDGFNKNFSKNWNKGWSSAKKNLINSFNGMKRNTSNWGNNIHRWYDDFNKNFSKNWNRGWSDTRKNLSNAWSKMQGRTSSFGSGMHDWLSNFGSRFKAGWKSLSRGVRNIFGDMWDAMKRLGKNAMGGLIDIVNAGISGINTVIHAFGGSSHTIKRIPKRFASGTGAFSGPRRAITEPTLAMVNDGFDSPETGNKEALFRPSTGEFGIFQGRNTTAMLMPGDEVLNASETAMVMQGMGITHFAKGTGFMSWLGGIGSWISNTAGHLKDLFNMATKIVAHPINYVKDIFNFKGFNSGKRSMKALASGLFDQANKYVQAFWKTLWSMVSAKLDGGGAEGGLLGAVEKYGKGKPYVWGAEGPDAFDCSGLVKYALEKSFGKSFPHYSGDQYAMSRGVSNPQIGDLVFFGPGGRNHVGVYAGNGKIWSAMSPSSGIGMANVSDFHEGAVSYRRIPGLKNENGEGTVKANSNLEKFIKNLPGMSGFFKFIGKISDLFGIAADAKDPAGTGADRWGEDIKKAAETMHTSVTPTEIRKIISMIAGESGGNPRVTQPGADPDGDGSGPARGLLQYKTSTFNHYKVQGHGNIYHGWDQLLALFNDSNWRNDIHFGAGWGPTGHRRFSGSWHGNGGEFDKPEVIGVGEDGPEFVINPQKSTADHLINKAILQRAKVAPESPTASLARIMEQVKYSSVAGYGTPDNSTIAGQNIVKVNNQAQAIDGNTVIKFIVSDKEMARATYPTIKMLQAHDITIKQQGGAVPIV